MNLLCDTPIKKNRSRWWWCKIFGRTYFTEPRICEIGIKQNHAPEKVLAIFETCKHGIESETAAAWVELEEEA